MKRIDIFAKFPKIACLVPFRLIPKNHEYEIPRIYYYDKINYQPFFPPSYL